MHQFFHREFNLTQRLIVLAQPECSRGSHHMAHNSFPLPIRRQIVYLLAGTSSSRIHRELGQMRPTFRAVQALESPISCGNVTDTTVSSNNRGL